MKSRFLRTLAWGMLILSAHAAAADSLLLRTGQTVEGHFLGRDAESVRFDTPQGEIRAPRSDVVGLRIQVEPIPLCIVRRESALEECDHFLLRVEPDALLVVVDSRADGSEHRIPMQEIVSWRLVKKSWHQRVSRAVEQNIPVTVASSAGAVSGTVLGSDGLHLFLSTNTGERVAIAENEIQSVSMQTREAPAPASTGIVAATGLAGATREAVQPSEPPSAAEARDEPVAPPTPSSESFSADLVPVLGPWRRGRYYAATAYGSGFALASAGFLLSYENARQLRADIQNDVLFQVFGVSPELAAFEKAQSNQRTFGWSIFGLLVLHAIDATWNSGAAGENKGATATDSARQERLVTFSYNPEGREVRLALEWRF